MSTTTTLHRWDIPDGPYVGSCTLWVDAAGRVTGGFDRRTGEIPKGRHSNADDLVEVLGFFDGRPVQLSLRDYLTHSRERGLLTPGSPAAIAADHFERSLALVPEPAQAPAAQIWEIPPSNKLPDHFGDANKMVPPPPAQCPPTSSAEQRGNSAGTAREQRETPDSPRLEFTWRGRTYTLAKHPSAIMSARKGAITREKLASGPWYLRVSIDGKLRPVRIAQSRSTDAIAEAKRILTQRAEDAPNLAKALDSLRPVRSTAPTIRQIVDAMMSAPISTTEHTRRGYVSGTKMFLETTLGPVPAWDTRTIDALTPDLVYKYRSAVHARLVAAGADDLARARAYRTGNSILRDIRALFTPQLQEHYRISHVLTLPDSLAAFREAPGFDGATKSQTQYRRPSDALLASTLADLVATRDTHRARYIAVWLALGFGLRKSEAAAVRAGWFREINGRVHLELRAVVEPGSTSESPMTKNGEVAPLIPCANGAWERLAPLLATVGPEDYAIPASSPTERRDGVFREISTWLESRGWETQKHYHEFRALGGCWLAETTRDLYTVSRWLRHSSVTVTERAYGRYLRTQTPDVAPEMMRTLSDSYRDTRSDSSASPHQTTPNDTNAVLFSAVSDATISPDAIEPQRDPSQLVAKQHQSVRSSVG